MRHNRFSLKSPSFRLRPHLWRKFASASYPLLCETVAFSPFSITYDHLGTFRESIVWGRIEDSAPLAALVKHLRYELAKADIPFDNSTFSPHFTLARHADFSKGIPPVEIEPVTMTVDKITLYRSDRGKTGMIYTEIGYVDAG